MTTQIDDIFEKFGEVFLGKQKEIRDFLSKYAERLFKGQTVRDIQRVDATKEIKKSGFRKNVSSWRDANKNVIISTCLDVNDVRKRYDYTFVISEEEYIEKEEPTLEIPPPVEDDDEDLEEERKKQEQEAEKKRLEEEAEQKRLTEEAEMKKLEEEAKRSRLEEERRKAEEEEKLKEEPPKEVLIFEESHSVAEWLGQLTYLRKEIPLDPLVTEPIVEEPIEEPIPEPVVEEIIVFEESPTVAEWLEQLTFLRKEIPLEPLVTEPIVEEPIQEPIPEPIIEEIIVFEESPTVAEWLEQLTFLRKEIPLELIVEEPIKEPIPEPKVEEVVVFEASPSVAEWLEQLTFLRKEIPLEPIVLETEEIPRIVEEPPIDVTREEERLRKEEEQEQLIEKAKEIEELIKIEENVLPLVEEFSREEILGDISDDMDEILEKVGTLLEDHRVEVKKEMTAKSVLTSASGEKVELEKTIEIEKTPEKEKVAYSVHSGLTNPFDDVIEEAILTDLIPYSYEITEIQINGTPVKEASKKNLTKEGVEITWVMTDIPPKESVDINYDLRRRISRTAIFILKDQLKIIKTHSNLGRALIKGVYEADIPFTNTYDTYLDGVIIEDIIPLYYIHFIQVPQNILPATVISNNGEMIKWNIGKMNPGTRHYVYKLLELYKYEELKIAVNELNKEGLYALYKHDFVGTADKYDEIIELIEKYLK